MKKILFLLLCGVVGDWLFPLRTGETSQAVAWGLIIPAAIAAISALARSRQGNRVVYEQGNPNFPGSSPRNQTGFDALTAGQGGGGGGGSQSSSWSNTIQKIDQTQTPFVTPEYANLGSLLRGNLEQRLGRPTGLPFGYLEGGIRDINATHAQGQRALENRLGSAGLLDSPAAAAAYSNLIGNRMSDISKFRTDAPLTARNLQNEDLNAALQVISALGRGQRTQGTTNTTTNAKSVSLGGGGGGGSAPMLPAGLFEAHDRTADPGIWGTVGNIAGLIGMMYGSGAFGGGGQGSRPQAPSTTGRNDWVY